MAGRAARSAVAAVGILLATVGLAGCGAAQAGPRVRAVLTSAGNVCPAGRLALEITNDGRSAERVGQPLLHLGGNVFGALAAGSSCAPPDRGGTLPIFVTLPERTAPMVLQGARSVMVLMASTGQVGSPTILVPAGSTRRATLRYAVPRALCGRRGWLSGRGFGRLPVTLRCAGPA